MINDSLIGPIDLTKFSEVIRRIRASKADVIGLTENLERGWHLQSFFLAFKQRALRSTAFVNFIEGIVCYEDKRDVISEYELRLASMLKRAGLECEPMFRAIDARNPTAYHWKELIDSGFPFVKAELFGNIIPQVNADDCLKLLSSNGFDIRLVESSLADLEPADSEPPHPEIMPPPIKSVGERLAWRGHARRRGGVGNDPLAAATRANARGGGSGQGQIHGGKTGSDPPPRRRIARRTPRRNVSLGRGRDRRRERRRAWSARPA